MNDMKYHNILLEEGDAAPSSSSSQAEPSKSSSTASDELNVSVNSNPNSYGLNPCKNRVPKYIVLHYTAGTSSKTGTAKSVGMMFAKGSPTKDGKLTKASADFIVDDGSIYQYNPDVTKFYCNSVGATKDSLNAYGKSHTTEACQSLYGTVKNSNSISIEMCSSKKNTKSILATDTDWYFTPEVLNRTKLLVKALMTQYNVPDSNIITHHHVTGKLCPAMWTQAPEKLNEFFAYKSECTGAPLMKIKTSNLDMSNPDTYKDVDLKDEQLFGWDFGDTSLVDKFLHSKFFTQEAASTAGAIAGVAMAELKGLPVDLVAEIVKRKYKYSDATGLAKEFADNLVKSGAIKNVINKQ